MIASAPVTVDERYVDIAAKINFHYAASRLLILPQSAWNPPATIRLLFKANEVDA